MSVGSMVNLEGYREFDVRWAWAAGPTKPGITAVLRIKDEAATLPWVLPPLFAAVQHIVMIDNRSTDASADIARKVAAEHDAEHRLEIHPYPFEVSRCGPEHLATPARSVHSLAYYYNWAFSHVRTSYALKWDGDMVLTDQGATALRDLSWQLEGLVALTRTAVLPFYLVSDDCGFLDVSRTDHVEPYIWPNRPGYTYIKAFEWELRRLPELPERWTLPPGLFIEVKRLGEDEFANWSDTDFSATHRTGRKHRELSVCRALAAGEVPDDLLRVEAPAQTHVLDRLRRVGFSLAQRREGE